MLAALLAAFVVAVSPPAVPEATGDPLSASSALMYPLPEPMVSSREVTPPGGTQSVVVEDLSAQYDSSHWPEPETFTVGVVCDTSLTVSARVATVASGAVGEVPL
jgi:hypothetical protein